MLEEQAIEELLDALTHVLGHATDPHALKLAARSLARHPHAEARALLTTFLRNREFLGRLDEVTKPSEVFNRLRQVFEALRERPDEATRGLCLALGRDPGFVSIDERNWLLLETLAEVRPMDPETVDFFAQNNLTGYATINAPLLVHNATPLALELFCKMIRDPEQDPEERADTLRTAVLPNRDQEVIVNVCEELLSGPPLPDAVSAGVVESLYDHHSRKWFGPAIGPPKPPQWESTPTETLQHLLALAPRAKAAPGVSEALAAAVTNTETELRQVLLSRGRP